MLARTAAAFRAVRRYTLATMTAAVEPTDELLAAALAGLSAAADEAAIEAWRIEWLGRQEGRVTALLRSVREQPPESRAAFGAAANALKQAIEQALGDRQEAARKAALEALSTTDAIDVSLPGRPQQTGRLHPVTQTMRDCIKAFVYHRHRSM